MGGSDEDDEMPLVSSLGIPFDLCRIYHREAADYYKRAVPPEEAGYPREAWQDVLHELNVEHTLNGDVLVANLRKALQEGFNKVVRSDTQQKVHEAAIEAMLPFLYGEEWKSDGDRIRQELGLDYVRQECAIVMSRRQGKTYSVAMFVAAMLLVVPNVKVCVWSTTYKISRAFMELVCELVKLAFETSMFNPDDYKTGASNMERFSLIGPDGTERFLLLYPATGVSYSSPLSSVFMSAVCIARVSPLFFIYWIHGPLLAQATEKSETLPFSNGGLSSYPISQ